ncbi:unnamed protein product, partial [marine sediment metagenome]
REIRSYLTDSTHRIRSYLTGSTHQIRSYLTGFTLVEVLIVIVFILVLVSIVLMATSSGRLSSEEQLTRATIELLDTALQEYYDYTDEFPRPDLIESDTAFDSDYSRHNASLYAQLNLVPDSKKIFGRLPDSQIDNKDRWVSFTDRWGTSHDQERYLLILDAWGTVFNYLYDENVNTFPVIISAGPDRNFETTADNIDNRD